MSEIADRVRTQRQHWAAPGSRHDRFVTLARWMLPSAIGVLTAFLVMAPIYSSSEVSFVLDKKKVEVARERMKIQAAEYRGVDDKGQPFSLDAGSAIQRSSAEPVVQLNKLSAAIRLSDGPATVSANSGRYDMRTEQVQLDGPLDFKSAGGYDLRTHDATIDLQQRTLVSGGAVTGQVPQGNFSANKMRADLENRSVRLEGNARLRIVP
ncbi:LPS export ABC transporter periplasmic protein LptC [Sphingomonas sp. gentR]|jgi:lipopolysaccharide export system protein LptC|uniref:LPS export ABC transporter periplasmic protein LptC n=1 Tax=Sphingomonas yabuuchiae TaxID=172044 RepID=A0AA41A3B9_9SPHN|nr:MULTISPECIES: LPS export ABC transporter periplasmic protein LptC [Sphingomonas]APX65094.1 LPS export ABC transporter periplasmic protein LptC [Sphingomonas sp. LK11]KQO57442.1 LPS export ABC transporter periplasmic protein LptC [Sphingomonas sp. Leaf257]MBB4607925.1 lipopolysaccharide export system protein LptC [Sphingomonas yabuuchiae]MBN3559598.1 LPS export ABC transporter periplasmic protein LptC [Sphingomonas yabuuchiae]